MPYRLNNAFALDQFGSNTDSGADLNFVTECGDHGTGQLGARTITVQAESRQQACNG